MPLPAAVCDAAFDVEVPPKGSSASHDTRSAARPKLLLRARPLGAPDGPPGSTRSSRKSV